MRIAQARLVQGQRRLNPISGDGAMQFGKDRCLIVREEEPFNAGPPVERLCEEFVTPTSLFFVRNHGSVPDIDPDRYRLSITGLVRRSLHLSLDDLQRRFSKTVCTTALQCAGNRRSELMAVAPIPGELPWDAEAVGNAVWAGVPLHEVLTEAGVNDRAAHVAFLGLDMVHNAGRTFSFGGSISVAKAMRPEVLLAYEMNNSRLPPVHGFPLRVIVPGYIGARSVKWLREILVQSDPSANYFQTRAYKLFPPHIQAETADWSDGLMLGELPTHAAICCPRDGETVHGSRVVVKGYAVSGGQPVERVEVSGDGGQTWGTAFPTPADNPWTWRLYATTLTLPPGKHEIVARAWDSSGCPQPQDLREVWNFKGYVNSAWHRVRVGVTA